MDAELKEWQLGPWLLGQPFPWPRQIVTSEDVVFYTGGAPEPQSQVVRIDLPSNIATSWDLPFVTSSASDLQVSRASALDPAGRYVFVTDGGSILRLEPATNHFAKWQLPMALGYPLSLAFDGYGHIYFGGVHSSGGAALGRLDPLTNGVTIWPLGSISQMKGHAIRPILMTFGGDLLFGVATPDANGYVARLTAKGSLTLWGVPNGPNMMGVSDAGHLYLGEQWVGGIPPISSKIARLNTLNNLLTTWTTTVAYEAMAVTPQGDVYVTDRETNVDGYRAVDRFRPQRRGLELETRPASLDIIRRTKPIMASLETGEVIPIQMPIVPTVTPVAGTVTESFVRYALPSAASDPCLLASDSVGNIFFSDQGAGRISQLIPLAI